MYRNFHELSEIEEYGRDYRIFSVRRSENILICAPHGGRIEEFTSEIAEKIASDDLSLYIFEGIKNSNNKELHIKSTEFDEPSLEQILKEISFVLTVHGLKGDKEAVYVGGLDTENVSEIVKNLSENGFYAFVDKNPLHSGTDKKNICNRSKGQKGVQLEITKGLRQKLSMDTELRSLFSGSVRKVLKEI